jgi:hypothetical protein
MMLIIEKWNMGKTNENCDGNKHLGNNMKNMKDLMPSP